MVDPDRFKVELDLQDGKAPLRLWFTPGAIRKACVALRLEVQVFDLETLFDGLKYTTLPTWIWAGRLWEDRSIRLEIIEERVDQAPLEYLAIAAKVSEALRLAVAGKKEESAPQTDPPEAATTGPGEISNGSPSGT